MFSPEPQDHIPLKEGLKQPFKTKDAAQISASRPHSIKRRIETELCRRLQEQTMKPQDHIPLKEGLKPTFLGSTEKANVFLKTTFH